LHGGDLMRFVLCIIMLVFFSACSANEPSSKVSAADAIKVIQQSESNYSGVTTTDAIAGLLKIKQSQGGFVDIVGWSQDYRSGGTHDVWFKVKTNDSLSEFHWVITPDGMINPANKLAQNVTKKQLAKL